MEIYNLKLFSIIFMQYDCDDVSIANFKHPRNNVKQNRFTPREPIWGEFSTEVQQVCKWLVKNIDALFEILKGFGYSLRILCLNVNFQIHSLPDRERCG